ncbi:MAG TPA: hydantoinase B/oxoprolinase family protein, partial [Acidimicrobiales bacterium]
MTVANTTDVAGTTNATDTDHDIRRRRSLQEGYLPPARPYVDASLPLHTEQQEEDDVVLAEIIRNKLWNINVDHGEVLRRVSGSNIVIEGYDFNCAITTEIGDAVTCSPFSMFFAGIADAVIKWTLEFRSTKPGIRPGDIFVQDDPWVGSNHQMDTATFAPLFLDGELYAWVFNCV